MTSREKALEQRCRRLAASCGLRLEKSRRRDPDGLGWGYQLIDTHTGFPVYADWGTQRGFGLDLDDIEDWLNGRSDDVSMVDIRGPEQAESCASSSPTEPLIRLTKQQKSKRAPDDALVDARSFQGVCLASGLVAIADRAVYAHTVAVDRAKQVVELRAASDHRDRGAKAALLAIRNGIALLGDAAWLDADAREALRRLLEERLAVGVDVMGRGEITVRVPTPSGAWWRLPATVRSRRALAIEVAPVPEGEEVLDLIDGAPAFTEQDELAGFVRVVPLLPPYQPGVMIQRPAPVRGKGLRRVWGRRSPWAPA